jgi:L-ascorbate metabolism protein UlaG (beta-lactamase superfamily)
MKITRYPQSCLLVQDNGHSIVIDPGFNFLESHSIAELADVEAVLYTHQHRDHYDASIANALRDAGQKIYCNEATSIIISSGYTLVQDGDTFMVAGFTITARELAHMTLPDGSDGPQNTGYVINGVLFHPGDGKDIDNLLVDTLALPITGPDMSPKDAFAFANKVQAKKVIPIHYDGLGANPHAYKKYAEGNGMPFEMIVLDDGQSVDL